MKNNNKTLTIALSALAFLMLSVGTAYAASDAGFRNRLSDEQKEILQEANELRDRGDYTAAHEIMEKSGIEMHRFQNKGSRGIIRNNEEVREAIENDDYEAFLKLTEDTNRMVEVDEYTFNKIVEAHSLRVEGDYEGAHEIMEEIGFGRFQSKRINR